MSSELSAHKQWLVGAVVVVLAIAAVVFVPPWLERRARARAIADTLEASEALLVELEACVIGDVDPEDVGRFVTDKLLLEREYQRRYIECVDSYDQDSHELLDALELREDEPKLIATLRLEASIHSELYNPGLVDICMTLTRGHEELAEIRAALGRDAPASTAPTCPTGFPELERSPRPLAPAIEAPSSGWEVARTPAGRIVARRESYEGPTAIASIAADGERSALVPPPHLASGGLLRWGPRGPVALARPDATRTLRGKQPYRLEVWTPGDSGGAFESRPLPRDMGYAVELWLTPARWVLASAGADPRDPTAIALHLSDDEGERYRTLHPPLPQLPSPRRFELHGHADGAELLLLAIREAGGPDDHDETLRELPPTAQIGVVRVDASAQIEAGQLEFEHEGSSGWGSSTRVCATERGAMAVLDGQAVIHVEGVAARVVHRFAPAQRLVASELAVACHRERLVMLGRRVIEPDPIEPVTGIESAGGPLYRHVCDAEGCDAGEIVTDWALSWDLRASEAGVRGLVVLHVAPAKTVYLIDEPIGGPVEHREIVGSFFSPIDAVVWDGVTFVTDPERDRWGWF